MVDVFHKWNNDYVAAFNWAKTARPNWSENQWRDFAIASADMASEKVSS